MMGASVDMFTGYDKIYGPWVEVFAWFPVKTVDGDIKWLSKVYQRQIKNIIYGGNCYEYGTLLDVMRCEN